MDRREITAAVVQEADRLLAEGMDYATISARLGITQYVVRVIAGQSQRCGRPQPPQRPKRRAHNRQNAVDAATVRMIQRMLEVGILSHVQIAREAGVSANFVTQVAKGKRLPVATTRPALDDGERFLPEPIRCCGCGQRIAVLPCRICRALRRKDSGKIPSRM